MSATDILMERIQKKEAEIHGLEEKLRAAKIYVQALRDVVTLIGTGAPSLVMDSGSEPALRPGSAMAQARDAILRNGSPMHVDQLLLAMGKESVRENRISLASSLAAYVRRDEIFTRPAPNTFGLIELKHFAASAQAEPPPDFGSITTGRTAHDKAAE